MKFIVIITVIIPLVLTACAYQCRTCSADSNPYACSSCPDDIPKFIFSCPPPINNNISPFVVVTIVITTLHLILLSMGFGVYREIFQNIQLATLITWKYQYDSSTYLLGGTNLAIAKNNNFLQTFGPQFIILLIALVIFWSIIFLLQKNPHSPTAILFRRKKIIFPVRLATLIFNILLFSSLAQIFTVNSQTNVKVFTLILAVIALIFTLSIIMGLGIVCNWKQFQVDDPHYYVLVEQLTSKKWHSKNCLLFSLINRGIIIISFIALFSMPQISGIIIIISQVVYTMYFVVLLRYTKIRYFGLNIVANVLMVIIFLASYVGSISVINQNSWKQFQLFYQISVFLLVGIFFFGSTIQIMLRREVIIKQIKSIYYRFIKCEKLEEKVVKSKYDQNSHRQKVTQFHTNLLYHKQLSDARTIEMTPFT